MEHTSPTTATASDSPPSTTETVAEKIRAFQFEDEAILEAMRLFELSSEVYQEAILAMHPHVETTSVSSTPLG